MRSRLVLGLLVLLLLALALPAAVPAQTSAPRVIRMVMTSYRFEPSLIQVRQGERVVLQLVNADQEQRAHSIAARLFVDLPITTRGDVLRTGVADGRRFVAVDVGKTAEVEFVATQRGTFPFICGISDHAARGQTGALNVLPPSQ